MSRGCCLQLSVAKREKTATISRRRVVRAKPATPAGRQPPPILSPKVVGVIACCLLTAATTRSRAADGLEGAEANGQPTESAVAASASAGAMLFVAQAANVDRQQGIGMAFAGYDGALGAAQFESAAEVRVFGEFALRGSAVYSPSSGRMRPSVGGKAQVLRSRAHGVDGTIGFFYRPEGLTEPEGEIEGFVSIGRAVGASYLVGNLFYGQDPEGNERDGEVRLAGLRLIGRRWLLGFDGRARFDLGSNTAKLAPNHEAMFDAIAGPVASVVVGSVALSAEGGASVRRMPSAATVSGAFAMAGIGAAF